MLHTHFIPLASKFILETIHTTYFGGSVYRDMCHRNQMSLTQTFDSTRLMKQQIAGV